MKKLLNTLYVTSFDAYLSLDGENIVITRKDCEDVRVPLHNLEGIVGFGYTGASPALMGKCADRGISLTFMTTRGRFLARVIGENRGNVLLRKQQYRISDNEECSIVYARNMITGKLLNSRSVLERACRDYALRIDTDGIHQVAVDLKKSAIIAKETTNLDTLRGVEGKAAVQYFSVFDEMILQQKESFYFKGRNKRPPLDNVNALLSFIYTLLAKDVISALESVGLDPYVGFMHCDVPGRASLALDMMEELRPILADRFVLSLINRKVVNADGFRKMESGAVIMDDDTRKSVLSSWQKKKQETIQHPFLDEKVEWGLIPYVQALLLARTIRGDLDEYPPFLAR